MSQAAQTGDRVKVGFIGKMENGDIFVNSQDKEPLDFKIGDGTVLIGVDKAVKGMQPGERKTVTLPPHEGFGERNPNLIHEVDRSYFPPGFKFETGLELQIPQPQGGVVFLKILELLDNDRVKLDTNHPLAGKTLTFELELLHIASQKV